jgi:hypothetical protein
LEKLCPQVANSGNQLNGLGGTTLVFASKVPTKVARRLHVEAMNMMGSLSGQTFTIATSLRDIFGFLR